MKKLYLIYSKDNMEIVETWAECQSKTKGKKGVLFKSFQENEDQEMIRWFVSKVKNEESEVKRKLELQLKEIFELSNKDLFEYYDELSHDIEFKDIKELDNFLKKTSKTNYIAFVDGSYNEITNEYSYGFCIEKEDNILYKESKKFLDENGQRQINGELKGAIAAVEYAISKNISKIYLGYDYKGIKEFPLYDWKTNSDETKEYKERMKELMKRIEVIFVKIPSHNLIMWNEYVDFLAKKVLGIEKG